MHRLEKRCNVGRWKENMDAKKLTGMMVAVLIAVPIVAAASPEILAWIEIGLVGLLYVVRRRRLLQRTALPI